MKKPLFPVRVVFQVLSAILCFVLALSLAGTVILLDLKQMTSSDGLQTVIPALLSGNQSAQPQAAAGGYLVRLSDTQPAGDISLTPDMLTSSSLLTDYIYDIMQGSLGRETEISREQVQSFLDASTITDYASEKAASYISDAIRGEETTTITSDELMQLFEENSALLEEHFDVTITDEITGNLRTQVEKVVEENDINAAIRENVNQALDTPIEGTDYTAKDVMQAIGRITSAKTIAGALALCLVLCGLLLLLNYYRLSKGLRWIASACTTAGLPLAIAALVLQVSPQLLAEAVPQLAQAGQSIAALVSLIAPIHYGLLALGLALLVLSIVLSILGKARRALT